MAQGIGFKDDDGSYGFKLTDDGKVVLGNTADDLIQVTGTLSIDGNLSASAFYGNIYVDQASDSTAYHPVFVDAATGEQTLKTDMSLAYNPSMNVLYANNVQIDQHLILDATTDPSTASSRAHVYAKDVASSAEVFVRDEAGNVTQISPHNSQGEWQYFSKNMRTGKVVKVNMEKMIKRLEEITGESFLQEWYEEPDI